MSGSAKQEESSWELVVQDNGVCVLQLGMDSLVVLDMGTPDDGNQYKHIVNVDVIDRIYEAYNWRGRWGFFRAGAARVLTYHGLGRMVSPDDLPLIEASLAKQSQGA